jgi:nitrogen regulatory protein P-II 1
MTVINVSTISGWVDPETSKLSIEYCDKYCGSVQIELVCSNDEVEKFTNIILDKAHTGRKGDGKIFISEVNTAISIRTKKQGAEAL